MIYGFFRYGVLQTKFFVILDRFCPFTSLTTLKMENFEKPKKTPGDIILHKYTKNYDHKLYCSLDMAHNRCNYFSFWAIFYAFTPPHPEK